MDHNAELREKRRRRRARRALRASRAHMVDPQAKLPKLLAAYAELRSVRASSWVLPDA